MRVEGEDEALKALTAGFHDEARPRAPAARITAAAREDPTILGVARTARGPAILVNDTSARSQALRWGKRYIDAPCEAIVMSRPRTLPLEVRPQWWGWKTPAYGSVVGGKTFYRKEDPAHGDSGGTLSLALADEHGQRWACGNVHCYAAMHGTAAPREHRVLWEAEWKAPFADVTGWHQITTSRDHRNFLDFGVARIRDDWDGDVRVGEILDVGRVTGMATMKVGDVGMMNGATTGRRDKPVIATDVVSRIAYGWVDPETGKPVEGEFILSGLIAFGGSKDSPASLPGDSGSPVAVRQGTTLLLGGFIFAGNGANGFAFSPQQALKRFGLEAALGQRANKAWFEE